VTALDDSVVRDFEEPRLPEPGKPVGRSLVDRARERHERRSDYLDLPIPEWDGDVVVRFERIPRKTIVQAQNMRNARASNAQLLVDACREILVRDDDGTLHPASEGDGIASPVRFDARLAEMFGLRADNPRQIVAAMYADDIAIAHHGKRVYEWQTGEDLDLVEPDELEGDLGE
jgi:hypothetical protein